MVIRNLVIICLPVICLHVSCQAWGKFWLAPAITGAERLWGGAGDQIKITGNGFGSIPGDLSVFFNGKAGQVNAATPSEIEVIVPEGATSGKIRVQASNGSEAISDFDFRINKYFLYVTSSTHLHGFNFNQTNGSLTPLPGMPLVTTSATGSIVAAFEYKYLYTTSFSGNHVGAFQIDRVTGTVTVLPTSPEAVGTGPGYLCIDSKSRYLYVANGSTAQIHGFSIDANSGDLTALPGSAYAAPSQTLGIAIDPTDSYVFAAIELGDAVRSYTVQANGSLVAGASYPSGDATRGLVIHPTSPYIYTTSTTSTNVHAYRYSGSVLTSLTLGIFPINIGVYAPWLHFDRTGKFLYVASQNATMGIFGFHVDTATGALTAISGSPFAAGAYESRGLLIDPYNKFLFSARSTTAEIKVFSFVGDGSLAELAGGIYSVGTTPQRFLVVSAQQ